MATSGNRKFSVLLYPDSEIYDCDEVISKLDSAFQQFAYIKHERDFYCDTDYEVIDGKVEEGQLKKPHIHVVGRNQNPCLASTIAKKLGIPENFVEYSKGSFKSAVRYLVHLDQPDKADYEIRELSGNFDYQDYLDILSPAQKAKGILQIIDKGDVGSKRDLLNRVIDEGLYSEYVRAYKLWMDIYLETNVRKYNNEWRSNDE